MSKNSNSNLGNQLNLEINNLTEQQVNELLNDYQNFNVEQMLNDYNKSTTRGQEEGEGIYSLEEDESSEIDEEESLESLMSMWEDFDEEIDQEESLEALMDAMGMDEDDFEVDAQDAKEFSKEEYTELAETELSEEAKRARTQEMAVNMLDAFNNIDSEQANKLLEDFEEYKKQYEASKEAIEIEESQWYLDESLLFYEGNEKNTKVEEVEFEWDFEDDKEIEAPKKSIRNKISFATNEVLTGLENQLIRLKNKTPSKSDLQNLPKQLKKIVVQGERKIVQSLNNFATALNKGRRNLIQNFKGIDKKIYDQYNIVDPKLSEDIKDLEDSLTNLENEFKQETKELIDSASTATKDFNESLRDIDEQGKLSNNLKSKIQNFAKQLLQIDSKIFALLNKINPKIENSIRSFGASVDKKIKNATKQIGEQSRNIDAKISDLRLRAAHSAAIVKNKLGTSLKSFHGTMQRHYSAIRPSQQPIKALKTRLAKVNIRACLLSYGLLLRNAAHNLKNSNPSKKLQNLVSFAVIANAHSRLANALPSIPQKYKDGLANIASKSCSILKSASQSIGFYAGAVQDKLGQIKANDVQNLVQPVVKVAVYGSVTLGASVGLVCATMAMASLANVAVAVAGPAVALTGLYIAGGMAVGKIVEMGKTEVQKQEVIKPEDLNLSNLLLTGSGAAIDNLGNKINQIDNVLDKITTKVTNQITNTVMKGVRTLAELDRSKINQRIQNLSANVKQMINKSRDIVGKQTEKLLSRKPQSKSIIK